jgi:aspartate/methionine/tyrosine aminotransferase
MTSWQARIKPQPMFDVLTMAREKESQGHYVARMEIGDTPGFRNHHIHELVTKYSSSAYRYSPSQGEGLLISKVIETQWPNSTHEQIVIGPANFLITAALASVTSPGDFVMLPDPGFATYQLAADFLGLRPLYYPVYQDGKPYFPDLKEIIVASGIIPKAIMINNPSNPLGVAFDGTQMLERLQEFSGNKLRVIIDETYVNLVYDNTVSEIIYSDAIRLRSFSKEHCAPGLRVGYAVADRVSVKTMSDLMSLSISCVPQFIQFAIAEYLGSPEATSFTSNLKKEMSWRLQFLADSLPEGLLQTKPNAAFYSLIEMGERGGDQGFSFLLEKNVSTCPGSKFGQNSKNSVRVSLAGAEDRFEEDVNMLASALAQWKNI